MANCRLLNFLLLLGSLQFFLLLVSGLATTERPDLLRFILNVRQGIRQPQQPALAGQQAAAPQPQQTARKGEKQQETVQKPSKMGQASNMEGMSKASNGKAQKGGQQQTLARPALRPRLPPPLAAVVPTAEDPYGQQQALPAAEPIPPASSTSRSSTTAASTTAARTSTAARAPPCGPDVLFVLDSTGSVRLVYEDQRKYILDVAQQMDIDPSGQHVGLILYSSRLKQKVVVELDQPLTKAEFLKTVSQLPYHGGITATGTALQLAVKVLAKRRPNKRTLVVVLTDGFTYDEWEGPAKALHAVGVDVIVAGDVVHYARFGALPEQRK